MQAVAVAATYYIHTTRIKFPNECITLACKCGVYKCEYFIMIATYRSRELVDSDMVPFAWVTWQYALVLCSAKSKVGSTCSQIHTSCIYTGAVRRTCAQVVSNSCMECPEVAALIAGEAHQGSPVHAVQVSATAHQLQGCEGEAVATGQRMRLLWAVRLIWLTGGRA